MVVDTKQKPVTMFLFKCECCGNRTRTAGPPPGVPVSWALCGICWEQKNHEQRLDLVAAEVLIRWSR